MGEFEEANTEVAAICVDSVAENADVAERMGITFPILSDPELKAIDAFGLRHVDGGFGKDIARPAVFLFDGNGALMWKSLTDTWRVRVRPEELLERLASGS